MASTPPIGDKNILSSFSTSILQLVQGLNEETRSAFANIPPSNSPPLEKYTLYMKLSEAAKDVITPFLELVRDSASLAFDTSLKVSQETFTPEALAQYKLLWEKEARKLENAIVPALESTLSRAHLRTLYRDLSVALDNVRKAAHLDLEAARVNPPSVYAKTPPHRLEKAISALEPVV